MYLHVSCYSIVGQGRARANEVQIIKALSLLRHPLAYSAIDRVVEILALSNLDPYFVDEAARGFGVLAEGKGKGKGKGKEQSHLTGKVSQARSLPKIMRNPANA